MEPRPPGPARAPPSVARVGGVEAPARLPAPARRDCGDGSLCGAGAGPPGEGATHERVCGTSREPGGGSLAGLRTRKQKMEAWRGVVGGRAGWEPGARGVRRRAALPGGRRRLPAGTGGPQQPGSSCALSPLSFGKRAPRASCLRDSELGAAYGRGVLAHATRKQTSGHLTNIHQTPAVCSQQPRPCSWETGTLGGGGRVVGSPERGKQPGGGGVGGRGKGIPAQGAASAKGGGRRDAACRGRCRAGSRGRGRTGAFRSWGALEVCAGRLCARRPPPPGGSGGNTTEGTVRGCEVGGRGLSLGTALSPGKARSKQEEGLRKQVP